MAGVLGPQMGDLHIEHVKEGLVVEASQAVNL
jgi:hypothetical protein